MSLFKPEDYEIFESQYDDLEKQLINAENTQIWPTYEDQKIVENIVYDFIRHKKRKLYGGTAQNMLLKIKNPEDAFYEDDMLADLDFYSPSPIEDGIELVNIFHDKGYEHVEVKEAIHQETYKVRVNFQDAADISYVPRLIYHRIPFVEIDGIHYVASSFILIDMYRMFTDPLGSGTHRWKKTIPRLIKLTEHYPLHEASKGIDDFVKSSKNKDHYAAKQITFEWLKNKESTIMFGRWAYNKFLEESKIMQDKQLGKKYKILNVPYYEFISNNYEEDAKGLYLILKEKFGDTVKIQEAYPFWQFLGYSSTIYIGDDPVAYIIDYYGRCVPTKHVNATRYMNGKIQKESSGKIQMVSYALMLLYTMSLGQRARVTGESEQINFYNIMVSHLIEMKDYYHSKNKTNMMDDTLFQEFIVKCVGKTQHPIIKALLRYSERKKQGKRIVFAYRPHSEGRKEPDTTYRFANTSGNLIRNERNYRVMKTERKPSEENLRIREDEPVPDNVEDDDVPTEVIETSDEYSDSDDLSEFEEE